MHVFFWNDGTGAVSSHRHNPPACVLETPTFSAFPHPSPLRPGAHRFAWVGGVKMEEGTVNTAEPNHIRLLKKGTREGEDEKRVRAEEKSLTSRPQWATEMKNRSYTSYRRQSERPWRFKGTADHSHALFFLVRAQDWKRNYHLIIETYAVCRQDFHHRICGMGV